MNLGNSCITKKYKMLLKILCVLNAYLQIPVHFQMIYLHAFSKTGK